MAEKIENLETLTEDQSDVKAKLKAARLAFENWAYDQAIEILNPIFEESFNEKEKCEAATLLGSIYCKKKYKKTITNEFYDAELADKYITYAVARQYPEAMYLYGIINLYPGQSYIEKEDVDAAIMWLELAAEGGYPEAYYHLGFTYYNKKRNLAKGLGNYFKAAECGEPKAFYDLGIHYHGNNNYKEALKYYKQVEAAAIPKERYDLVEAANEQIKKINKELGQKEVNRYRK